MTVLQRKNHAQKQNPYAQNLLEKSLVALNPRKRNPAQKRNHAQKILRIRVVVQNLNKRHHVQRTLKNNRVAPTLQIQNKKI